MKRHAHASVSVPLLAIAALVFLTPVLTTGGRLGAQIDLSAQSTRPTRSEGPEASAATQERPLAPSPLLAGDQVRVTWTEEPIRQVHGYSIWRQTRLELVEVDGDRLIGLERGKLRIISASAVERLERRTGTRPATSPAVTWGSIAGVATGLAAGALVATIDGRAAARPILTVRGGVLGSVVGSVVAFVLSRSRGTYEVLGRDGVLPVVERDPNQKGWGAP